MPLELDEGPDLGATLRSWPAEQVVKCNVYCHPDDDEDLRERQERLLLRLFHACVSEERQLLVELQPPKGKTYGPDSMPHLLRRLYELGVRPDWWKLPPRPEPDAWSKIGDAVREHDPHCAGVLVLGQAASEESLAESFAATAGEPLCKGFAVGRSIYGEPARRWLSGEASDEELMDSVLANYERMISLWKQRAAHGSSVRS